MKGITPFSSGRPLLSEVTADKLNAILSEIKRNRPVVAAPLSARVTGDGTHISIKVPPGGASTPATPQPWDIIATPDPDADPEDENPSYIITVLPGTLTGFLPTNWDEEFECAGTGLFYAKAVITTNGTAITSVTIAVDSSPPDTQEPTLWNLPNSVEYLFGLFSQGSVRRTVADGHIVLTPKVWLTTEKEATPAPGELPYDYYYILSP
jgi:hypothetical protein